MFNSRRLWAASALRRLPIRRGHDEYSEPGPVPVTLCAQAAVEGLVVESKLSTSWGGTKLMGRELRTKDGAPQRVVIFQNEAECRRARRMLYLLMSPAGTFISARHTLT